MTGAHVYHYHTLVQLRYKQEIYLNNGLLDKLGDLSLLWGPGSQTAVSLEQAVEEVGVQARLEVIATQPGIPYILLTTTSNSSKQPGLSF